MDVLRWSLFDKVSPYLNYIPTLDNQKIHPPAGLREQLWRIPQAVVNILNQGTMSGKQLKMMKNDDEELLNQLFPDNVKTISDFKNNHFGCPLSQAIIYNFRKISAFASKAHISKILNFNLLF